MIQITNIYKTYASASGVVEALRGVDLHVSPGEIHGVIGYSGAGKSTLVRCINLLERPNSGTVRVGGDELTVMPNKKLREKRREIGMIFQHFNLFASRTVYGNVAFPLAPLGLSKPETEARVCEMLAMVGLEDKAGAYPAQLSGGQKQRVAIARALASRPKVLLCDEATSALDPRTTLSILRLLGELNAKLGLTIVIVTHEMQVVKEICGHVSVMENGVVCETGTVYDIFANPKTTAMQGFVDSETRYRSVPDMLEKHGAHVFTGGSEILLKLKYAGDSASKPLVSQVSRIFNVDVNILFGSLELITCAPAPLGTLAAAVSGVPADIDAAIEYLRQNGAQVEVIADERMASHACAECGG